MFLHELTYSASLNFIVSVIFISLTTLFVLIRFVVVLSNGQIPKGPDWLCLLSALLFDVHGALIINFISRFHTFDLDPRLDLFQLQSLAKLTFVADIIFTINVTLIKLSVLWFYYNLFSVTLKRTIWVTVAVCIAWLIAFTLILVFQCTPVQVYWERLDDPKYCLTPPQIFLGYELTNLLVDVAILFIPVRAVLQLQLSWSKKVPVLGVFCLGSVVCVASIIRLSGIWKLPDPYQNFDLGFVVVWSIIHLGLAIITSCLPTFGPLLPYLWHPFTQMRRWYRTTVSGTNLESRVRSSRHKLPESPSIDRPWGTVDDVGINSQARGWAFAENPDDSQYALHEIPLRHILVKKQITIV